MIGEGQDPGSATSALGDVVCAASDLLAQGRLPLVFALTSNIIPGVQPIRLRQPGKRGRRRSVTRDSLVMTIPMVNPCDCIPAVPRGEKAPGPVQRNMLPGSGVVAPHMRVVS
ncbi:hypothetical protein C2U30_14940 [Aeromonas sp. ASNIH5]|nr:hypothetical protein C2U30_14940 [Aeromonas sp. ASNIH5]